MKITGYYRCIAFSLSCTVLFLPSCGYHMAGTKSSYSRASLFLCKNKTMEPIIGELTPAVMGVSQDGRIEVADSSTGGYGAKKCCFL
jgi:hypothetical protein